MMNNNVIPLPRLEGECLSTSIDQRIAEADRLTMRLIHNEPVVVAGIQYTLEDAVTNLLSDTESRIQLQDQLCGLLNATMDREPSYVSRINRLLIASARELAFRLSGQVCCGDVVDL